MRSGAGLGRALERRMGYERSDGQIFEEVNLQWILEEKHRSRIEKETLLESWGSTWAHGRPRRYVGSRPARACCLKK